MPSIKNTVVNSLLWKFLEQCAVGGAGLIIGIILARLLLPEDYAILIIATVFISLSKIFIDSGFSSALIQKKEITDADTSSVFLISLGISIGLYILLFFLSPVFADIYNEPLLTPVLRVLGITLLIGVFSSMQQVFVSREFKFKKQFIVALTSALISGVVGIILAYNSYGVWALVAQQVISSVLSVILLWFLIGWRPKLLFSKNSAKSLFSFGWKILASSLLYQVFESLRNLTIGLFYQKSSLSFYSKGNEYPQYLSSAIDGSVAAVLFPAYSKYQDDKITLKEMLRKSMSASAFVVFPAMFGLAAISNSFVEFFLTEKWMPCVIFMQIFCIYFALQPITSANLAAIKAIGRSDTLLRLEIIKRIISYSCLIIGLFLGVLQVALMALLSKILSVLINAYPNRKLLNYHYSEMMKDLGPSFILSVIMAAAVYSITFIGLHPAAALCIQIPLAIIIYVGIAKLLKMKTFEFTVSTLLEYVKGMRNK